MTANAPIDAPYSPQTSGGGPPFKVLQVQAMVGGVPTLVSVEGVMLIDADGRLILRPDTSDHLSLILQELRGLRLQIAALTGLPTDVGTITGAGG